MNGIQEADGSIPFSSTIFMAYFICVLKSEITDSSYVGYTSNKAGQNLRVKRDIVALPVWNPEGERSYRQADGSIPFSSTINLFSLMAYFLYVLKSEVLIHPT